MVSKGFSREVDGKGFRGRAAHKCQNKSPFQFPLQNDVFFGCGGGSWEPIIL